ncbi:hypothetical protein KY334_05240 [Candidatus Woesearchaeota archaeon]|nr:hypothetical protein [Candidatus Woesearchaeota archaeon]
MCDWIILTDKDDLELNIIQDLIDNGITNIVPDKRYKSEELDCNACLCQIDIESTLKSNSYGFERDIAFGYYAWRL